MGTQAVMARNVWFVRLWWFYTCLLASEDVHTMDIMKQGEFQQLQESIIFYLCSSLLLCRSCTIHGAVIDVIAKFPASCYDSSVKTQLSENLWNNSPVLDQYKSQEIWHYFLAPTEQQIWLPWKLLSSFVERKELSHKTLR